MKVSINSLGRSPAQPRNPGLSELDELCIQTIRFLSIDAVQKANSGQPDELVGTALWLLSDAAKFVTGVVIPIDGGFSAFSGV
jgi:NAD(P)-dependent dehydrogenase (short-subunit alcohol dehydrogenase family)